MGYSPERTTWLNPDIEYLLNEDIIEYDIRSAGLSLIKQFRLLDPKLIDELSHLEKFAATVRIGKLQGQDRAFSRALLDKFAEMRATFISANGLTDDRIISVKKDAIFTIGSCDRLAFGEVTFVPKHSYSSYLRFSDIPNTVELYLGDVGIDVKGISDISLARHKLYMLNFISKVTGYLETKNTSVKHYLAKFIADYRAGELDDGYYLEFNNVSATIDPAFNYLYVIRPIVQLTLREMSQR